MERNKYNPELRGAGKWWVALALGVTAVDVFANETLSNGCRRGMESENPLVRAGVYGLGLITVSHLADITPESIDPIDNFAHALSRLKERFTDGE